MSINLRIEKIIADSGLSHAEFSEKIDVQRSSISHILSGRNKPSLDFLKKTKDAFPNLSWDWIIEGKGEMYVANNEAKQTINTTPLPDLFSFVAEKDQNQIKDFDNTVENTPKHSLVSENKPPREATVSIDKDSNSLVPKRAVSHIKKVILLYEDGHFESFDP